MDQFPKMKRLLINTLQGLQLEQISPQEWSLSGVSIRLEKGKYVVFYFRPCDSVHGEEPDEEELEGGESVSLELAIHLAIMIHFYQSR